MERRKLTCLRCVPTGKMFSAKFFDEELYSAYLIDVKHAIHYDENETPRIVEPVPLTGEISDEWLSTEVHTAYWRDAFDPFYRDNEERMSGLEEVSVVRNEMHIVVVDADKRFFGKIQILPNDATLSVNALFLYVSGDRRRRTAALAEPRNPNRTPSAGIIWYFVAQFAEQRYKSLARVLIPSPLRTVTKYLVQYEATFVRIKAYDDMLYAVISTKNTIKTQEAMMKRVVRSLNSPEPTRTNRYPYGALFSASSLIQRLT